MKARMVIVLGAALIMQSTGSFARVWRARRHTGADRHWGWKRCRFGRLFPVQSIVLYIGGHRQRLHPRRRWLSGSQ
jgi:hypothetical protein